MRLKFWASCLRCGRVQRIKGLFSCPACHGPLRPIGWGESAEQAKPVFGLWDTWLLTPDPFRNRWLKALSLEVEPQGIVGEYVVNDEECECPDFAFRGGPCKHLIAWHSVKLNTILFVAPEANPHAIAKQVNGKAHALSFGSIFAIIPIEEER